MKNRFFVTGDTHGSHDIRKLNMKHFPQQNNLTKDDFLIVCGDFGLVWDGTNEEKYWQEWLGEKSFTTLFIDGNHENFNMLEQYPVEIWNGGKIHRITDSIFHLMRGQVFTIHGKKFFTMGGATSVDRHNRVENKTWWRQEIPSWQEYEEGLDNLEKNNWEVDYIITHTAPQFIIEQKMRYFKEYDNSLNSYLTQVYQNVKFEDWYFGHMHDDLDIGSFHLTYWKVQEIK